ncbi:MAG: outer membrane lipoprotein LolB [Hylemonella sp.]|nr:outer membrane lipoprotein LolB [Hylemonella sp.]
MKPTRRMLAGGLLCTAAALLTGCAQPIVRMPGADGQAEAYWRGRLALRVDNSPEPTSFFASFELSGQPRAGELMLSTPLGTTLARLRWSPQLALLSSNGQTRAFDSLDDLATEATGTALPIAALFEWLQGRPATAEGWQADLTQLDAGRVVARRSQPAPAAELRLIIEP